MSVHVCVSVCGVCVWVRTYFSAVESRLDVIERVFDDNVLEYHTMSP